MTAEPFVFEQLEPRGELLLAGETPADRAASIVAEARVAAADMAAAARAEGFAAGLEEGRAAAADEMQATRAALDGVLESLRAARDEYVSVAEREAVELAVAIAEKVVGAALAVDPQLVCEVVGGALRRATERDRLALEVNPDDVEIVRAWLDAGGGPVSGEIEIRSERRVDRGGCVVRTIEGEIDARIGEQLDRAREILLERFAGRDR